MKTNGAQERTRTSTTVRPLAPEASASASSATWAQMQKQGDFDCDLGKEVCQSKRRDAQSWAMGTARHELSEKQTNRSNREIRGGPAGRRGKRREIPQ